MLRPAPDIRYHIAAILAAQYIGRYTKRAVMAEYRIVYYDGNAHFAVISGVFHDTVFCALRSFSTSKKDPPQADLGMP